MDEIAAYHRASERLLGLIDGQQSPPRSGFKRRQRAGERFDRSQWLLAAFGYSHDTFPVVHITGTSGKGSTAALIAAMLTAAGYRVGLRTSPYLQVATEKLQLGSRLIDAESLDRLSDQVMGAFLHLAPPGHPDHHLGYAEAWIVLTLLWFAERQVDVAVIEVGAGGRYDSSNIVDPAVCVITSVGIDHVSSLGPTIGDIAWHKAGIIKSGSSVVVGQVPAEAWDVIQHEARLTGANILRTRRPTVIHQESIGMAGAFQHANAEIAVAAVDALTDRGFSVSETAIEEGLRAARLPGRLERMPVRNRPLVWIDGAHNADKIEALARELTLISDGAQLPVVLLGVLGDKDVAAIVSSLSAITSAIVTTQPAVLGRWPLSARQLAAVIRSSSFAGTLLIEPDPESAVECAEELAIARGSNVLVTGSMYLAGQVRRRWYPDADIVVQRTPWPAISPATGQELPERSVAL